MINHLLDRNFQFENKCVEEHPQWVFIVTLFIISLSLGHNIGGWSVGSWNNLIDMRQQRKVFHFILQERDDSNNTLHVLWLE